MPNEKEEDEMAVFCEEEQPFLFSFNEHSGPVYSLSICNDKKYVLSGGGDDLGYLWSLEDPRCPSVVLPGHSDSVISTGFNFDSSLCVTASMDGTARVFNVPEGTLKGVLEGPKEEITCCETHPKSNLIMFGSIDSSCWVFDLKECIFQAVFTRHLGSITAGKFVEDKLCLTASSTGELYLWNVSDSQNFLLKTNVPEEEEITALSVGSNSFIVATSKGRTCCFSLKSGECFFDFSEHKESVEGVGFYPKNDIIYSADLEGVLRVWSQSSQRERFQINLGSPINKVVIVNKSPFLFCSLLCGDVVAVDIRSGEIAEVIKAHSNTILDFLILKGVLITAGEDGICKKSEIKCNI